MLLVFDTFDDIKRCFPSGQFSLPEWKKYAAKISKELPDKIMEDIARYSFEKDVLPVVQNVYANWEKLELAHTSFQAAVDKISKQLTGNFHPDCEIQAVFYLGLCSGAGWATTLEGKPAVLLGAEKILELKWLCLELVAFYLLLVLLCSDLEFMPHSLHMLAKLVHTLQVQLHQFLRKQLTTLLHQLLMQSVEWQSQFQKELPAEKQKEKLKQ